MEYEIYSISDKGVQVCHIVCSANEVDKELKELVKQYPGRKWIFGTDIHFRKDIGKDKLQINWY